MKNLQKYLSTCLIATAALFGVGAPAWAQVSLGAASGFAVLGGTNVTSTGGVILGDVGVAPGSAVPFTNTGSTISGATPPATDAAAIQARVDFLSAYAAIQLQSGSAIATPGNLSGLNLPPGVYGLDAVAKAGTLTLTGPSNGIWIFIVNGALTGTNFSVVMAGGGDPCKVFWAPSAAATMTTSAFKGNILAGNAIDGSITLTGGSLAGRVLASVAVTMTDASVIGCKALSGSSCNDDCKCKCKCKKEHEDDHEDDKDHKKCNQGVGNGPEGCDPGNSNHNHSSNDEDGGTPGNPGRKGGKK